MELKAFGKTYRCWRTLLKDFKYKVSETTLRKKMANGMTLEEAINDSIYRDHLGYIFGSKKEMCKRWNVSTKTFTERFEETNNLEYALTKNKKVLSDNTKDINEYIEVENTVQEKDKSNSVSIYSRLSIDKLLEDTFEYNKCNLIRPTFIAMSLLGKYVVGYIQDIKSDILPWDSNPNRSSQGLTKLYPLVDIAKKLDGYFMLINFTTNGEGERLNQVKVFLISDRASNTQTYLIKNNKLDGDYFTIDKEFKLTMDEFKKMFNGLNEKSSEFTVNIPQTGANNYKKYKKKFYKDPIPCKDHRGIVYTSKSERARAYGHDPRKVDNRIKAGWTLEKALTTK